MKILQNTLILTAMFTITSCTQDPMATIEGYITEAEGRTLYLDHIGIE